MHGAGSEVDVPAGPRVDMKTAAGSGFIFRCNCWSICC